MKKMLFNVSVLSATISNALKTAVTCGLLLVTGAAMAEDNFIVTTQHLYKKINH